MGTRTASRRTRRRSSGVAMTLRAKRNLAVVVMFRTPFFPVRAGATIEKLEIGQSGPGYYVKPENYAPGSLDRWDCDHHYIEIPESEVIDDEQA